MKTGFYTNPIYHTHNTGAHPENASRLRAIEQHLETEGVLSRLQTRSGRPAEPHEVNLLHTRKHIDRVEDAASGGVAMLDTPECVVSSGTYEAALHAVGAVLDAVVEVSDRQLDNAFCAVRPPGHHAERDHAMGFCFFNNIALAAEFLAREFGYSRIAIVDFDVHHGNGTQHLFEERPDVLFISTHQDPRTCYPGTGFAKEQGTGQGTGYTVNVPLASGTEDEEYLHHFRTMVLPALEDYQPQFMLVSAGFDAHRDDPLASLNLTERSYREVSHALVQIAEEHAGGRLVSLLEGGYDLRALSTSVREHVSVLMGEEA